MSEILRVEGLKKRFPGVIAVDDLSFFLEKGEVLAILGENGAGKSTLTKMICGALKPEEGSIYLDGKKVTFNSARDAMNAGVAMVYQELSMAGSMTLAENIFISRQPVNRIGFVKTVELHENAQKYIDMFGINATPSTLVKRLPMGEQQLVEISKAVSMKPKVLILDEPTSSLAENNITRLFELIGRLKKEEYSFIYITHKLSEIFKIADRVMVMRDGKRIGIRNIEGVNEEDLITMMVGREIKDLYVGENKRGNVRKEYFSVRELSLTGKFKGVSFDLRKGEILGLSGLIGAGRTEVARTIAGLETEFTGEIALEGKKLKIKNPRDAMEAGIGYITEDRKNLGLFLDYAVSANLIAPSLKEFSKRGFIREDGIHEFSNAQVGRFNIVTPSIRQKMMNLSGGNQQKCLLAMWMSRDPAVLIFDEPTRGVDVGAKSEIYEKIREYVSGDHGAIVISSDLSELLGICDRIAVMYHGKVRGILKKEEASEETVMSYASGLSLNKRQAY
ncbi:MAG: sugar ABC transporter ATP-binding protein [Synergistaceae bacterium]|nr:sugar ABC transporter ATP-binding protein [Synergistaceae bacterium]